jgi:hypothetical protein
MRQRPVCSQEFREELGHDGHAIVDAHAIAGLPLESVRVDENSDQARTRHQLVQQPEPLCLRRSGQEANARNNWKSCGQGSSMLLFTDEAALAASNPLDVEWVSGKGEFVRLAD